MADETRPTPTDDADETARVAALVARAGLKLPVDQIAELVEAYRADQAGLARLRSVLAAEDEPAHVFRAGRARERST